MYLFLCVFGFSFIIIFSTIIMFVYYIFPINKFTSFLNPIRKCTYNNINTTIFPTLVWDILIIPLAGNSNLFILAVLLSIIVALTMMYSIKTGAYILFEKENSIIDLTSIVVSTFVSQMVFYLIIAPSKTSGNIFLSLIFVVIMLLLYILLYFKYPKIKFFKGYN